MKKIDIYIIKKFLGTFFFAISLLIIIVVVFDAWTAKNVGFLGYPRDTMPKLAKLAGEASGGVWIRNNSDTADATSMLDIMTLVCTKGTTITVWIDDASDLNTLERIAALIRSGFGE